MNRRNFFKFAGKGIAALGVVAVTGLPDEIPEAESHICIGDDCVGEEVEWEFNIPKYNSDAEIVNLPIFDFWHMGVDDIYAGGQFTAMPNGLDYGGIATFNGAYWGSLDDWILEIKDD